MKFGRDLAGYTMFEVTIVLAISGILLFSAVQLFRGQSAETGFDQAVHDINSELTTRIKKVSTSYFPDSETYQCIARPRPTLSPAAGGSQQQGSNQECIYLGVAIEAVPQTSDFYFYTVLGSRTDLSGAPITEFSLANPEPIIGQNDGPDLTANYNAGGYIKIAKSTAITTTNAQLDSTLVGYYSDLSGSAASGQTSSEFLIVKGYSYNSPNGHNKEAAGGMISGDTNPADVKTWEICLHDSEDTKSAILQLISSPTGVTSNIKFVDC